jgi:hypothetical protein
MKTVYGKKVGAFYHIRLRSPKQFKPGTFRTQDVGAPGGLERTAGVLKKTDQWATQRYLVEASTVGTQRGERDVKEIEKKENVKVVLR